MDSSGHAEFKLPDSEWFRCRSIIYSTTRSELLDVIDRLTAKDDVLWQWIADDIIKDRVKKGEVVASPPTRKRVLDHPDDPMTVGQRAAKKTKTQVEPEAAANCLEVVEHRPSITVPTPPAHVQPAAQHSNTTTYHSGTLKVDYDGWEDHEEDVHGRIDTKLNKIEQPEGFIWTCCDAQGDEEACMMGTARQEQDSWHGKMRRKGFRY